jgi:hypothetical protein
MIRYKNKLILLSATLIIFILLIIIGNKIIFKNEYWDKQREQDQLMWLNRDIDAVLGGKQDTITLYYTVNTDSLLLKLKNIKNLKCLIIQSPDISDKGIYYIKNLSELLKIKIYGGNPGISDKGKEYLSELPKLEELFLWNPVITDKSIETLKKFPNLNTLTLYYDRTHSYHPITDNALKTIGEIDPLKKLTIGGTWYSKEALKTLRERRLDLDIKE